MNTSRTVPYSNALNSSSLPAHVVANGDGNVWSTDAAGRGISMIGKIVPQQSIAT